MKTLNKVLVAIAGVATVGATTLMVTNNNFVKTYADTTQNGNITFDGVNNCFIDREGSFKCYTSNDKPVDYTIDISENLQVETNGSSITLRSTDTANNYYSMHFAGLKGVKKLTTTANKNTNITTTAYHYGTSTFSGYIGNDALPNVFTYEFSDKDSTSDYWNLTVCLRCPAEASVTFYGVDIVYSITDCLALN